MGIFDLLGSLLRQPKKSSDREEGSLEGSAAAPATEYLWEMLASPSGTHCQFIPPNYAPLRLIDMIVDEPRLVLDVGCYCGTTGAVIKRRWPTATVIGIEPLAEAAEVAAGQIDRVITGTLEDVRFDEIGIAEHSFDVIVFADVLEHIYNPWAALQKARSLLTEDGIVLASIPNVRNLGLIHELAKGHWKYEGAGLLDITHIRFFTLAESREMFEQTGFQVTEIAHNLDPDLVQLANPKTEQGRMDIQYGSLTITNTSAADRAEFATRQFYIKARKSH